MKQRVVVLLISLVCSIAAAEIICRFLPLSNDTDPTYKLADPVLPYVMKPNSESVSMQGHTITINSHGLRDVEFASHKPEDTFRILVLGDSVTFAYGQDAKDGFVKVLERQLNAVNNKKYAKIEVINAGHPGFNLLDEYNYLRLYGLQYSPDVLVVGLNSNDFTNESLKVVIEGGVASEPGSLWLRLHIPAWVKRTLRNSSLYLAIGNTYRRIEFPFRYQVERSEEDWKKISEATADHLDNLTSLASKNRLPVYFVSLPDRSETISRSYNYPQFIQQIRDLEKDGKLTFVDTLKDFGNYANNSAELFSITDGAHTNAKGHQIIAGRLFESLVVKVQ